MKVLVCPDKFKGSLTALEVCHAVTQGIKAVDASIEVESVPMADGGEGTLEILMDCLNLTQVEVEVHDPLFRKINSTYGAREQEAFIEMALASGLQLLADDERQAMKASSFGTGELIKDALDKGARCIYLFVGGSATTDGGIGMAAALGVTFLNKNGEAVEPTGESLSEIADIVVPEELPDFHLIIVTDVKNTLLGKEGAAQLYGPQKGASPLEVAFLEDGMAHLEGVLSVKGEPIGQMKGSGAAGGMALAGVGLFGATIKSGIETLLEITRLEEKINSADLVITGEGKMDEQTLHGKVVAGVAHLAHRLKVPVKAVCGVNVLSPHQVSSLHLSQVVSVMKEGLSPDYCIEHAAELLIQRGKQLVESV